MKVYLAGISTLSKEPEIKNIRYALETFYSLRGENKERQIKEYIKNNVYKGFLLDSGAFTFMNGVTDTSKLNLKKYIDDYIDFINEYDIKHFFELDIDVVVGYEKVLEIRKYIEKKTGKKCIPVWHKSRGLNEFIKMTKEYEYAAIGGIVTKEIKPTEHKYMHKLIEIADKNNCKLHGLGFTKLSELEEYGFYSVDSTSWLSGGRFGSFYYFDGKNIKTIRRDENKRAIHKNINVHNLKQWIKYQAYMDKK